MVTAGAFVVPPVRSECMYDLGVRSVSGTAGKMKVSDCAAAGTVAAP